MEEVQDHDHKHKKAKRFVSQMISATIDGQVVSWMNVYAGPGGSTGLPVPVAAQEYDVNESTPDARVYDSYVEVVTVFTTIKLGGTSGSTTATSDVVVSSLVASSVVPSNAVASSVEMLTAAASSSMALAPASSGSWTRQAYYNAADGTVQGFTFLNHFGGVKGVPGTSAGGPASVHTMSCLQIRMLTPKIALVPRSRTPLRMASLALLRPRFFQML